MAYLDLCNGNGIIFNKEKFHFAVDEVEFAGFTITNDGIKSIKRLINAIANPPPPKEYNGHALVLWVSEPGVLHICYLGKTTTFQGIVEKNIKWYCDDTLDTLFSDAKTFIVRRIQDGIRNFEINRPCCHWTDWSKVRVGFSLLQKYCDCWDILPNCCKTGWRLVFAGSLVIPKVYTLPSMEGQFIAVVNALDKCKMFINGCPNLLVVCDHKPLVTGINPWNR